MRLAITFGFVVVVSAACWAQQAPPTQGQGSLVVLPAATGVTYAETHGRYQLAYTVQESYPARHALAFIAARLRQKHWKPLPHDYWNPEIPSSHVRGWDVFEDAASTPEQMVYQWMAQWENARHDIVSYTLEYRYPLPDAGQNHERRLQTLRVLAMYIPSHIAVQVRSRLPRYMTDIPQPIPPRIQLDDAPPTARDVGCFASFTPSSSMKDVVRQCGIPDEHQGSGIYIFLYDLKDGSIVAIGTGDLNHLMYVNHIELHGSHSLLHETPDGAHIIFQDRVTWRAGRKPGAWQTVVTAGQARYRLALVPLWAVEGGIVAIEVVLAREETPNANLLGERKEDAEQPFVITVEDLERGVGTSRFGGSRRLQAGSLRLSVEVLRSSLGEGVGDCEHCKNIQELTVVLTLTAR